MLVIKKDGSKEKWSRRKLMKAINKAGVRTRSYVYNDKIVLTRTERKCIIDYIEEKLNNKDEITTENLHSLIIECLDIYTPDIAKVYKDYHNYRIAEAAEYESVMEDIDHLVNTGNLDNANSDSMLVATQNNLAACFIEKSRFRNYFLTREEIKAVEDGFIYVHDEDHRMLYPFNCCLFNAKQLINNGFKINGVDYTKPKVLERMISELGDIILSASAAQYGGFTIARIEEVIAEFAEKTYNIRINSEIDDLIYMLSDDDFASDDEEDIINNLKDRKRLITEDLIRIVINKIAMSGKTVSEENVWKVANKATERVEKEIINDIKQGYQGLEYKLNTVSSSRGDFPFTTFTFGNTIYGSYWAEQTVKIILNVRKKGQGKRGKKKPVLFPKLIFLYDETLHGKGAPYENLYNEAVKCSCVAMYPDYISLTGVGPTSDIYCRYNGIERTYSEDGREVIGVKIKDGYKDGRMIPLNDPRRKTERYSHGHPEVSVSSMGCRSFLSPYYSHTQVKNGTVPTSDRYERIKDYSNFVRYRDKETGYIYTTNKNDHSYPIKESEIPIFEGRGNNGVITINLPLIYQYCKQNNLDFYKKLDYYLELIRKLHQRSIEFNGKKRASVNPYAFCYGGLIDSNGKPCTKKPNETLKSSLNTFSTSIGVTALNELQLLYNRQTIKQAMEEKEATGKTPFCEEVIDYILDKMEYYKAKDKIAYSLYGTPAEKLSGTQATQFKKMFPNVRIKGFTNYDWVSNSFHVHVNEDITPTRKQDLEYDLFHKFNGGHIQYVRINGAYNTAGVSEFIRRGMRLGFYQGINFDMSFCDSCGFSFDSKNMEINECPKCGSRKITTAERICGYLGFVRRSEFYEEDEEGNVISDGNRVNIAMRNNIKARKCM